MISYILSGGKSSRMGTDKGLILLNQKAIIIYLIETLQKLDLEIKIIAHHADYQEFGFEVIADVFPEKGPLGGIYTALQDAKSDCLIISVDTPFVHENHIEKMIKNAQKNELTLAFSQAKMYPLFGIYPFELIKKIKENINKNQLKLIGFLEENGYKCINFTFSDLEQININTKEELIKAEKILNNEN